MKITKGLKRRDFFPTEPVANEFYNREAAGGNVSLKGHFGQNRFSPYSERVEQQHEHRAIKRMYPMVNPPIEYAAPGSKHRY